MNGHKNWNHWNVALWIGNDEGLYRLALAMIRYNETKALAASEMVDRLCDEGITHTPDGAPYTKTTIRAAMREL